MEGLNSGAVSAPFEAALDAEVIIVIGANPTVNHPVAATFIKNAVKQNGAKLIVMDPRRQALSRHAYKHLSFKPGSDVSMLNAMLNVIITEKLYDEQYIAAVHRELRGAEDEHRAVHAGEDGAGVRRRCGDAARSRAPVRRVESLDHFLGHGHQPARARHRQFTLPDRARADHRADRQEGHGPAPAARPEQRAGRIRRGPHPDGLSRLPVGGKAARCASCSRRSGARSSIRRRA